MTDDPDRGDGGRDHARGDRRRSRRGPGLGDRPGDAIVYPAHGVATGLVSVPLRYMHSPGEVVSLDDVDATARLLAAFARRVGPGDDLVAR